MKKYTSPAVIGCASSALYSVAAVGPAISRKVFGGDNEPSPVLASAAFMTGGSPSDMLVSAVKYVASKLFGEDFSSLKPDALMPCLES